MSMSKIDELNSFNTNDNTEILQIVNACLNKISGTKSSVNSLNFLVMATEIKEETGTRVPVDVILDIFEYAYVVVLKNQDATLVRYTCTEDGLPKIRYACICKKLGLPIQGTLPKTYEVITENRKY